MIYDNVFYLAVSHPLWNARYAAIREGGSISTHEIRYSGDVAGLQRGNYVVTVSGQLVVIGQRVAIQSCFFARRDLRPIAAATRPSFVAYGPIV
jgi:hypothetical protein